MRTPLLAIDTAGAACSVALIADGGVLAARHEVVGRGHAERLAPMIDDLLRDAPGVTPVTILVDCGPGSFTGVRVGIATAIGLGLGWGVPVHGLSSTLLLAAALFEREPALEACAVAIAGGHDEVFVQRIARPFDPLTELRSLPAADAAVFAPDDAVIGSGAAALVAARSGGIAIERLPDAREARLLPSARWLPARPIYGRAPDARPMAA